MDTFTSGSGDIEGKKGILVPGSFDHLVSGPVALKAAPLLSTLRTTQRKQVLHIEEEGRGKHLCFW